MALPKTLQPGGGVRTAAAVAGAVPLAAATAIINPLAKAVQNINQSIQNNPINKGLDATGGALANAFNKISGREAPRQEKEVATNIKDSTNILEQIRDLLQDQAVATGAYQKKDLELKEEQDREEDRKLRKVQKEDDDHSHNITVDSKKEKEGADPVALSGFLKKGLSLLLGGGILYMFGDEIMKFFRSLSLDDNEIASNFDLPNILNKSNFPELYDNPLTDDGIYNFNVDTGPGALNLAPFNFNLQDSLAENNLSYNRPPLKDGLILPGTNILDPTLYYENFGLGLNEQYQGMLQENYLDFLNPDAYRYPIGDGTDTQFRLPQTGFYSDASALTSMYSAYNFGKGYNPFLSTNTTFLNDGFRLNSNLTPIVDGGPNSGQFASPNDAFKDGKNVRDELDAERKNAENRKKKTKFKNMGKLFLVVDGIMKGMQFLSAEATYEGQMRILDELSGYYDDINADPEIKEAIDYLYPELLNFENVIREAEEKVKEDYEIERGKIYAETIGAVGTGAGAKFLSDLVGPGKAKYGYKALKFLFTGSAGLTGAEIAGQQYEERVRELNESNRAVPHQFESTYDTFDEIERYMDMIQNFQTRMELLPGVYDLSLIHI